MSTVIKLNKDISFPLRVLGIEPTAFCRLDKQPTTELQPEPYNGGFDPPSTRVIIATKEGAVGSNRSPHVYWDRA